MVLWMGFWPLAGMASTRKPVMVSVLVLQVMVMVVSVTSVTRGLRGGLTSAPQAEGSCQCSGDWESHQPSFGEAWGGAVDRAPLWTQSRLPASAPTQH